MLVYCYNYLFNSYLYITIFQGVDYFAYTALGNPINSTAYMASLIANLESAGYVVGQNLGAAPVSSK